ncbi:Rhodanese-related sulfurtransferase [Candidatus Nitrosarchaeum limnium SFB1]|jgi:thiosulfate/3-mercaptopyruvate sulfurtransferase|uniref:Rhodanese-related sulfurtransferase n=1 Tax=Candidatus Nitrosarchaeum limnium SFB1 TaxID=886738 RepID=F3KM92_9ARCH|nr:Rhodanese-related sulfurtransferase [Candidatus Nitrosarchaeum limnium SFB1]
MLVSIDWLKEHQSDNDIVILDTRPKTMFLYGHITKSQSLTLDQVIAFDQYGSNLVLDEKKISELFGSLGIDDSKTVLLIGESMDPSVARIAWTFLYFGHEKTFLLDTNVMALQKHGFELTKKTFTPTLTTFTPKVNSKIRINSDSLKENLDDFVILDARTPQEFMGGHLPNSKLIPFTEGISYDTIFQDKSFLQNLFSDNQIPKESQIVCYCMHGHRASSLFLQLVIAGYENVKLYDGSFVDWYGRRLPLE